MKNFKEKLINLLKTCPVVKSGIEKLEFGCKIDYDYIGNGKTRFTLLHIEINKALGGLKTDFKLYYDKHTTRDIDSVTHKGQYEIIGLPLQERFIRMYCQNKNIDLGIYVDEFVIDYPKGIIIKIDNTKDFDNQEDKVYEEIYNALINSLH